MDPDSNARREALRLVRRGAAASLLGGLAYAGWQAAKALPPRDLVARVTRRGLPARYVGGEQDAPTNDLRPLDAGVRALTDAILSQTEDYGALALRAQLVRAQEWVIDAHGSETGEGIDPLVRFDVEGEVPLAVPGDAEFPVRARFVGPDGRTYVVELQVAGSRLSSLEMCEFDIDLSDPTPGVVPRWPRPDEVTFWIDTISGPEPVLR